MAFDASAARRLALSSARGFSEGLSYLASAAVARGAAPQEAAAEAEALAAAEALAFQEGLEELLSGAQARIQADQRRLDGDQCTLTEVFDSLRTERRRVEQQVQRISQEREDLDGESRRLREAQERLQYQTRMHEEERLKLDMQRVQVAQERCDLVRGRQDLESEWRRSSNDVRSLTEQERRLEGEQALLTRDFQALVDKQDKLSQGRSPMQERLKLSGNGLECDYGFERRYGERSYLRPERSREDGMMSPSSDGASPSSFVQKRFKIEEIMSRNRESGSLSRSAYMGRPDAGEERVILSHGIGNRTVTFNVSGETLVSIPKEMLLQVRGSMLASRFGGSIAMGQDRDGHVHVDHAPDIFLPMLEHLQKRYCETPDELVSPPNFMSDVDAQRRFCDVLRYYGILEWVYRALPLNPEACMEIGVNQFSCLPAECACDARAVLHDGSCIVSLPMGWEVLSAAVVDLQPIICPLLTRFRGATRLCVANARGGFDAYMTSAFSVVAGAAAACRVDENVNWVQSIDSAGDAGKHFRLGMGDAALVIWARSASVEAGASVQVANGHSRSFSGMRNGSNARLDRFILSADMAAEPYGSLAPAPSVAPNVSLQELSGRARGTLGMHGGKAALPADKFPYMVAALPVERFSGLRSTEVQMSGVMGSSPVQESAAQALPQGRAFTGSKLGRVALPTETLRPPDRVAEPAAVPAGQKLSFGGGGLSQGHPGQGRGMAGMNGGHFASVQSAEKVPAPPIAVAHGIPSRPAAEELNAASQQWTPASVKGIPRVDRVVSPVAPPIQNVAPPPPQPVEIPIAEPPKPMDWSGLEPLLLHFDVNKTVLFSDSVASSKTVEDGVRESISELFWGVTEQIDDQLQWSWTNTEPHSSPPEHGFSDCRLMNYAEYCKKRVKVKALAKEMVKSWELVTEQETKDEMMKLLKSSLKRLELPSALRYTKEAKESELTGTTLCMLPGVFALVALLQRAKRTFAILFRSFGEDHNKITTEWNTFCEMKHPVFAHLLEGVGPMDGSVPGIPDRRIHHKHTMYRDADGPVLILHSLTNGPAGANSWDMWAKQKPRPQQDTRNGRAFCKDDLKAEVVSGMEAIQAWIQTHALDERSAAIKDDWSWWFWNGQCADAGKLMMLTPTMNGSGIKQLFFDDNIDQNDARIVDCRSDNGSRIAFKLAQKKLIAKVNPVSALNDEDYFFNILKHLHSEDDQEGYAGAFKQFTLFKNKTADARVSSSGDIFDNPFSLYMLFCCVQMMPKTLEESLPITEVYSTTIDVIIQRTLRSTGSSSDEMLKQCRQILERIALAMHVQRKLNIGMKELIEVLPPELREVWTMLQTAMDRHHVKIMVSSGGGKSMRFMTKGVQAYLAASEVSHPDCAIGLPTLETILTDSWWVQMLEMLAEEFPSSYVNVIEKLLQGFAAQKGNTFLHVAAASGHVPVFELLRLFSPGWQQKLAWQNDDMLRTPLHIAAGKGNETLCTLMLQHGAKIDVEDKDKCWPMHVSMQEEHYATARLLADQWLQQKQDIKRPSGTDPGDELASRVLGIAGSTPISESEYLEMVRGLFVELRYFGEPALEQIEQKRVTCALLGVYWIVHNQYDQFVRSQAEQGRFSRASWDKLQEWVGGTVRLTSSTVNVRAMMAFVAISTVGKVQAFRTAFTPDLQEFSEALVQVLQEVPVAFPSFARLDKNSQQMVLSSLKASEFNFGQFLQAENTPANLLVVKSISEGGEESILGFFLFKIFAAMCGILGMKSLDGSLFMNEKMYCNFKLGLDVLQYLNTESPNQVFDRFLAERAKAQGLTFNSQNGESRALVRLACLARVFDSEAGKGILEAFQQLEVAEREQLTAFLNADGITVKPAFLLYNSPNLLTARHKNIPLISAIRMLLTVYKAAAKEYSGSNAAVVTIMVDELAAFAGKCVLPEVFAVTAFDIARVGGAKGNTQGMVALKD